ncbi:MULTISPECIES: ABC-three component system middle component 7 [unclassified Pseudomonas]
MISPNKFVTYNESALSKVEKVYNLFEESMFIGELYDAAKKYLDSIDQFMYAIEILYLNDKILVDFDSGLVKKC